MCVELGADITCSEMGLSGAFLQGAKPEWALTKRHDSEKTFGVQVCGSKPAQLAPCAEAIVKECPDVDFVDVNLGSVRTDVGLVLFVQLVLILCYRTCPDVPSILSSTRERVSPARSFFAVELRQH